MPLKNLKYQSWAELSPEKNLGKVEKGAKCSVAGCSNSAERSISRAQLGNSGLSVSGERRALLCHDHYKTWKKATKKDRELDRARFG